jgi:hypothetical protein
LESGYFFFVADVPGIEIAERMLTGQGKKVAGRRIKWIFLL